MDEYKKAVSDVKCRIDLAAPAWLKNAIDSVMLHPGTPYFFLGVAVEAMTWLYANTFSMPSSPAIDMLVALVLWVLISRGQAKRKVCSTN